jgi:hypothetical protein
MKTMERTVEDVATVVHAMARKSVQNRGIETAGLRHTCPPVAERDFLCLTGTSNG